MNNSTILILAVGLIALGLLRKFAGGVPIASGATVASKVQAGALVVDVRSEAEYAAGHYGGARNIPVEQIASRADELGDRSRPIVIYCASGGRSARAGALLKRAGFTDVTNAGGLHALP